jgi:hypothetical protein
MQHVTLQITFSRLSLHKTNSKRVKEIVRTTDEDSSVVFENVPIDDYIITVEDSKNFMGNGRTLELLNERVVQPSFNVFVELRPQVCSFLELSLLNENKEKITNAAVHAVLLPTDSEVDRKFNLSYRIYI